MRGWVEVRGEKYRGVVLLDDGSKRTQVGPGKRDAERWVRNTLTDLERGQRFARRNGRIVGELIETFIENSIDVRESTLRRNAGLLRNHVDKALGGYRVSDVTRKQVQALVTGMTHAGYAPDTVRKVLELCQRIFDEAVRDGLIGSSPCRDIRKPKLTYGARKFLSPSQVADLAVAIAPRYRALILTAGYAGLRIGELSALRLSNLDLVDGLISVQESASETSVGMVNGPLKTQASRRRVPMPVQLVDELKVHVDRYATSAGFVFTSDRGAQLRPRNWRYCHFHPAAAACGLEPLRPHELRHTAASIWIAAGVSQKELTARLGHSSIVMTNVYGHLFPESDKVFAERVASAFVQPEQTH